MATVDKGSGGTDITNRDATKGYLAAAGIDPVKGVYAILEDGSSQAVDNIRVLFRNNANIVAVGTTQSSGAMGSPNPVTYILAQGGPGVFANNLKTARGKTWTNESPKGGRRRRTRRKSRARKSRRSRK